MMLILDLSLPTPSSSQLSEMLTPSFFMKLSEVLYCTTDSGKYSKTDMWNDADCIDLAFEQYNEILPIKLTCRMMVNLEWI
jgi:hypothetical protein